MNEDSIYSVIYVEVLPPSRTEGLALLERYRAATRRENGSRRCEVLSRIGQPHQFAVLEIWQDRQGHEAHGTSATSTGLREGIRPIRLAPLDERIHIGVSVGPPRPEATRTAVHVVTHVDVIPPRKDDGRAALVELGDRSRAAAGNLRFEVVQQENRPNHFTILEIWKDAEALEAHAMAEATRQFRDALGPMSGALYDERLFTALGYST